MLVPTGCLVDENDRLSDLVDSHKSLVISRKFYI